jgi:tetratricopeptide (TPR) repeat protein
MTPDQITDHIQKAVALIDVNRFELAETMLREVLAIEPKHERAWVVLSRALMHLNKDRECFEAIDNALSIDPLNPYSHVMKATIAGHFGFNQLAIEHLKRAIEIYPEISEAYGLLAIYELNERNFKAAKNYATFGLMLNPEDSNCLNALASVKNHRGNVWSAQAHSNQALALDPEATANLYNSALLAFLAFRFKRAFDLGRSGLNLEPTNENLLWVTRISLLSMFLPYGFLYATHMNLMQKFAKVYVVIGFIIFVSSPNMLMHAREAFSYAELMNYLQWAIIILCTLPLLKAFAHLIFIFTPYGIYLSKVMALRSFLILAIATSCVIVLWFFDLESPFERVSKIFWHALAIFYLVVALRSADEEIPAIRKIIIGVLISAFLFGIYLQLLGFVSGTLILVIATISMFVEVVLNIANSYDRAEV